MSEKIISIAKYKRAQNFKNLTQKLRENKKMFFVVISAGALLGFIAWNFFVENPSYLDVRIPESKNITFNDEEPHPVTSSQIANDFEKFDGKPILFYVYTTWCSVCAQQLPQINEIAREFQNTDLQVITLATDRDLNPQELQQYLNKHGNIYFQPRYLAFKDGFIDLLKKKKIKYQGRIPFTVLMNRDGDVALKYVGVKGKNYLRNKVIKELYL